MNRTLLVFAILLLFLVIGIFTFFINPFKDFTKTNASALIKGKTIYLEIADTPEKREKGLSGKNTLAKDRGMIFLFESADRYPFWMKDMKIPIDIVFMREDQVVTIYKNIQPFSDKEKKVNNLAIYSSKVPANSVIELSAGIVDELQLREGDTIQISL